MEDESKSKRALDNIVITIEKPSEIIPLKMQLQCKYYEFFDLSVESSANGEALVIVLANPCKPFNTNLLNSINAVAIVYQTCSYLMNVIYKANLTNIELVTRILRARQFILSKIMNTFTEKRFSPASSYIINRISVVNGRQHGPYTEWEDKYYAMIINYSVRHGYIGFLQFLVKYGKCNLLTLTESEDLRDYATDFVSWVNLKLIHNAELNGLSPRWKDIFIRFQKHVNDFVHQWNGRLSYRRSIFIMVAMNVLADFEENERQKEGPNHLEDLPIKCLDFLNEVLPEPFITYQDIKACISSFGQSYFSYPDDLEMIVECLWNYLKKLLPKSTEFYNPRSLKHLARCKVRECIMQNASFPVQVSKLLGQTYLKDFVLFENETIEDDFREEGMPQIKSLNAIDSFLMSRVQEKC